ncbi:MAG: type II toxin-antitoxin system HicA family toxin [Candidatus Berkelbacteria bacterium]|nr:type II toxin-antitoxin system HicA family toxin [Candidatus Berkelbacteria bacterium]
MPKVTAIKWKEFEKFLLFVECEFVRQKGSHRIYERAGLKRPIVLPTYRSLPVFVIKNNLRILEISVEKYTEILKKIK